MTGPGAAERLGGIARLYGRAGAEVLGGLRVAVVGLGGVGSWAVEALARSGVGHLALIDHDVVEPSNTNRQIHALDGSWGRRKVQVMAERARAIQPGVRVDPIADFLTTDNLESCLGGGWDYVVDAIDSIRFKAAMIHFCTRRKVPVVVTGGAGGRTDPTRVAVADLSRTWNDPLAAKVRKRLREAHGFTRNPRRRFGVECVYSSEQPVYPRADGTVGPEKPGVHGVHLDCRLGYGATTVVTATFGLVAASRVINRTLARRLGEPARGLAAAESSL
jgi:tRNA A37 threonylcarbamoyladenosine dehydratase